MLRERPRRAALLSLAVLAWVAGGIASQVHRLAVRHHDCEQHPGEQVEERGGSGPFAAATWPGSDRGASLRSQPPHSADQHGCAWSAFAPNGLPSSQSSPGEEIEIPPARPVFLPAGGPRAPPLRYAPKTSPPRA